MIVDVPAYVVTPPAIVNQVQVRPGTNWDLARSAAVTPVRPLPDPPATTGPVTAVALPVLEMVFPLQRSTLLTADLKRLRALPSAPRYRLVACATKTEPRGEALARARGEVVAKALPGRSSVLVLPPPECRQPVVAVFVADDYGEFRRL